MSNTITSVSFDITYECNLRCRHCFNCSGEQSYKRKLLSKDEIVDITKQLTDLPLLNTVCFCGGETLYQKEALFESAKILAGKENSPYVNFVTNGFLITDEIVEEIKKSNIFMVQISLDGYKPESHNYIRNSPIAYERAIAAIKKLISGGVQVAVATLPTRLVYEDVPQLIAMLEDMGVMDFRMQPLMKLGRAKSGLDDIELTDFEYIKLSRLLEKENKRRIQTGGMHIEWGDPIQHLKRFIGEKLSYLTINAYGQIIVSPYLPIVAGDLREHDIKYYLDHGLLDVWKNEDVIGMANRILSADKMDVFESEGRKIFTETDYVLGY